MVSYNPSKNASVYQPNLCAMPNYVIHHKISTLLQLWKPFTFRDFAFSAMGVDLTHGTQEGWLAKKTIYADSAEAAFRQFYDELYEIVDQIAFIGQCHTTADLEAFLILKPGDPRFFWRYAKKLKPVPLHFNDDEIESLKAVQRYRKRGDVFRYLREATNATSFYKMLAMLVSALEAMAASVDKKGRPKADRGYIADHILHDREFCNQVFRYGTGIRNQILHGGFVDHDMHGQTNYNHRIYDSIIDYFNDSYALKIRKDAVGRPRTLSGSYVFWSGWCEWVNGDEEISLELLNSKFRAMDAPRYFRTIDRPDDF